MTFPHHDSAAFLEVTNLGAHWFVRQTCPCHLGRKVSIPFLTVTEAARCLVAMDEVNAQLLLDPLPMPAARLKLPRRQRFPRPDLRDRRNLCGLSTRQLATVVGMAKSAISKAELYGAGSPLTLSRIEAALSEAEGATP